MEIKKYVYLFDEGNSKMNNLLGGKGANLCEMNNLGILVPYGFIISTDACNKFYHEGRSIPEYIINEIEASLIKTEEVVGRKFGDNKNPLLVAVRSGARTSMPGIMDTILNIGLNDKSVVGLANISNNERFAYDSYRRFIQMYSEVVLGLERKEFEGILYTAKEKKGAKFDTDLNTEELKEIIVRFKEYIRKEIGRDIPEDPKVQLIEAVKAIFGSWNNPIAEVYRKTNDISCDCGTAVNVQAMVFGNMGENSGTGVAFTRNPVTGENKIFGEYLSNAQGEDIVSGSRTPKSIEELEKDMPEVYKEFIKISRKLEEHFKDMQDIEFTIEQGKLYLLQTRNGKRTRTAAVKIAADFLEEEIKQH
ncbi:pyruvate, phosphate dikinase [Clostridium grantii DSM 8605]|uniref:Pyruvate, phosphate dikinase n=1 Tax=Clostridium grantii DSM 8605 TaxID=1121316 RepID=A0A1M5S5E2_9CLOT|nr:pyruvate, phosphate dikinase [Clostridium grantii DSM 8605]